MSPAMSYAMGQGATLDLGVMGTAGMEGIRRRQRPRPDLLTAMIALFVVGLGMVSVAPLYGTIEAVSSRVSQARVAE